MISEQIKLIPLDELDREWASPRQKKMKAKSPTNLLAEWFAGHHDWWGYDPRKIYRHPKMRRAQSEAKYWLPKDGPYTWEDVRDAVVECERETGQKVHTLHTAGWVSRLDGQTFIDRVMQNYNPPPLWDRAALRDWAERFGERAVRLGKITQEALDGLPH